MGAVFLVLGGLLAMHGLGTHGIAGDDHAGMSGAHAAAPRADAAALAPLALDPRAPAHGAEHLMAGCVAVLGVAMALLLGLMAPRGGWRSIPVTLVRPVAVPRRARAPDPPDLVRLCVCRC